MADPTPIGDIIGDGLEGLKEDSSGNDEKKSWGGARPGSGVPVGYKQKKTLEARKVQQAFIQRIMAHADRLFNSQLNLAVGEQVLMVKVTERGPNGGVKSVHHEMVTDKETIREFLDEADGSPTTLGNDDEWYYITTRPANNMAIDSLVNRALGKVPDKLEVTGGFFNRTKVEVEVVDSNHGTIDIGDDGQLRLGAEGDAASQGEDVQEAESGDADSQPSPSN